MNISTRWRAAIGCGSSAGRSHGRFGSPGAAHLRRPRRARLPAGAAQALSRAAPKRSVLSRSSKASPRTRDSRPRRSPRRRGHACDRDTGRVRAETTASFTRSRTGAGPAYGLLLDALSPGWRRRFRDTDDFAALLAAAFAVNRPPTPPSASRYGGAEIRAAEEQRDRDRQAPRRAAPALRGRSGARDSRRGGGMFNSMGAMVIPDVAPCSSRPLATIELGHASEPKGRAPRTAAPSAGAGAGSSR